MYFSSIRHYRRSSIIKALAILFIICSIDLFRIRHKHNHHSTKASQKDARSRERIFITSVHWNNEWILRSHWNNAVVLLVEALGRENVYLSLYESGSYDDTKGALTELDQRLQALGIRRTILLDDTSHLDEVSRKPEPNGWIPTPRGKVELRRIPYLSRIRNFAMKPLLDLAQDGEKFDKILFLNDVAFQTEDVLELLATNGGEYAAACSLDFSRPPSFYDTFALRDIDGHEPLMQTWPYFRSPISRAAVESGRPVPVSSCWNGMVVMPSSPFYPDASSSPKPQTQKPLKFRGIPDSLALSHLEASECCLIHADNPLSRSKGVWLNPAVRVGYSPEAYDAVHRGGIAATSLGAAHEIPATVSSSWLSAGQIVRGLWINRILRWTTTDSFRRSTVQGRLKAWKESPAHRAEQTSDNGRRNPASERNEAEHCIVDEMQVLVWNGWKHV